jgi:pimeloyl-ACP methyl ester carboxylesterase
VNASAHAVGDPLVLLPGMMCDQRQWEPQLNTLSTLCKSVQVCAISQHDSIQALASRVIEDAPLRFSLAGLSMGGIVAFEIWRQAPERVNRLALLDTNAAGETADRQCIRDKQIKRVKTGGLENIMRDEMKPRYLAQSSLEKSGLLDSVLAMAMELGPEVFIRQSIALRNRPDSTDTLPTIDCPVLVMCGEADTLCPVEYHEDMAGAIPEADLVIIPQCGHLSTMEQPDQVSAAMLNWLVR